MPQQGRPEYLAYRVLNENTGAVDIPNLPHLHASTWTVRGLQRGIPGSSTLGSFTIPLPGPASEDFKRASPFLLKLRKGQKIEGYIGDVVTDSPRFTGVITGIRKPLVGNWEISGMDTLWWLQQSQVYQGETIGPGFTNGLVAVYMATREVVFDGRPTVAGGTWSTTTADPQFGQPADFVNTLNQNSVLITSTSWNAVNEYNWPSGSTIARASSITCWGTAYPGTDLTSAAQFGVVWLWDTATTSGYLARANMVQTCAGTGLYNVTVEVVSVLNGVFTSVTSGTVFTNVKIPAGSPFPFVFELDLSNLDGNHIANIFLNGKATGIGMVILHANLVKLTGQVGYWTFMQGAGSPKVYFNNLRFDGRTGSGTLPTFPTTWGTDRFTQGTITTGTAVFERFSGAGQSHLDMLMLASTLDGFDLRKTPKAGYKSDQIDYGPTLGADLSGSIVFEEGVNVLVDQTEVAPVADVLSTAVRVNAIPGGSSGGTVTWGIPANGENVGGNPAAGGDIVLIDTVSDTGTPGAALLLGYARIVGTRKGPLTAAIQVNTIRTADTADKFRELDYVQVHLPTLGVFHQKAQVVGYQFKEGEASQVLYLNEFADRTFVQQQLQRIVRSQEFLTSTYLQR